MVTHLWWQIPLLALAYGLPGIAALFEQPWEVAPGFYFFPPSGIAIGILWLFGVRLWPAVLFGAALVTLGTGGTIPHVFATSIGNTLEAVTVVLLLRKTFDPRFASVKDVSLFVVAAALGSMVSGVFGTLGTWTGGVGQWSALLRIFWMWAVGHFLGALLVGAAILCVAAFRRAPKKRVLEGLVMLATLFVLSSTAFGRAHGANGNYPLQYLAYPALIWAALRLPAAWVMIANLALTGTLLFWTSLGVGPISQGSPSLNLAYAATFSLTAWLTSAVLAAIVAERQASDVGRKEREDDYRAVVEQAVEGIFVVDGNGICTDVNGAGSRLLEKVSGEVIGQPFIEFIPDGAREEIQKLLKNGREGDVSQLVEWVYLDRSEPLWVEASVNQIEAQRTQVFARDITRRRSLERQVAEAQKMEAVGVLAGGVAHDFNNLLTVVLGQAGRAMDFVDPKSPAAECMEEVVAAARKSSDLTKQLLTFARKHAGQPTVIEINQVMQDRTAVIRQLLGERVRYVLTQHPSEAADHWVLIDPVEFEQVILNLVINAKDAMDDGGELTITTDLANSPGIGEAVRIRVKDVGHGMAPATAKRIFEPFFTTKSERDRTGLGLAVSYGIIQNAGGMISCQSTPGQGTEFTVLLPRATGPAHRQRDAPPPPTDSKGRGERILVIEDEDPVRELITIGLSESGYVVVGAPDGPSALAAHKDSEEIIDLVVSDVILPGKSGPEIVREIQMQNPNARAIFISGYDADEVENTGYSADLLLRKPFTIAQLRHAVRKALDQEAAPNGSAPLGTMRGA